MWWSFSVCITAKILAACAFVIHNSVLFMSLLYTSSTHLCSTILCLFNSVTRNYFENLVRALESGLNDVGAHSGQGACSKAVSSKNLGGKSKSGKNKAPVGASKSGSSTRGMDDGNIWACDQCTFANPRSARSCQVCDHQQHR